MKNNKDVNVSKTRHFFKLDRNPFSVSPKNKNSLELDEYGASIYPKSQLSPDNNPFLESDRNLSLVSPKNQLSLDNNPFLTLDKTPSNYNKDSIDKFFLDHLHIPSTPSLQDLVATGYSKQILPCILESKKKILERLDPIFPKTENDKDDKQSLLQKFAHVWTNIGEKNITLFEQYALLVIYIFISKFTTIRSENVEYAWGEIELDLLALRKYSDHDILSLPKVATEHK
ncbi:36184_t:CDS:2 [Gigaspora margarita]|uniref:36184_t:CDS:1 n=1 Tax=Gigaspora margarita TaxID=4874 RepID=A0ABN7WUV8_GIGMA|nr:36184_t:CDS:2 [Gigaspora margarita]